MSIASPPEVEVPVLASSKKQRSARNSGKKGWTPGVSEIRRLVGCSHSSTDVFSPHMLVWAKLDGGPWWPARVASVDEIPEDLKKQEEGWTCVKYYGVDSARAFAWLKAESLSPYEKHSEELSQQNIPGELNVGDFKVALKEIQEVGENRNAGGVAKSSGSSKKPHENKILPRSSSPNDEDDSKDDGQAADETEQPLKRRKLKLRVVDKGAVTANDLTLQSNGREALKDPQNPDKFLEMKRKRKRMLKQQHAESDGDCVPTGESIDSPTKKIGSPSGNSSSLSSREVVKKARGKKTGADGYYFECMVCDIGGDLLCCDLCPQVYHLECLTPPLKRTPPGKWICPSCRDTPGAVKGLGTQTQDSKPKFKTTTVSDGAVKINLGAKRGWKVIHKGNPLKPDMDSRKLRKRKREEEIEQPRKRLNLKINRSFPSQNQVKCRQCGARINSSGESPSNVFCQECVELVKQKNSNPTGKVVVPRKDVVPTRHSKLKPGKCDICSESGFVIFCDVCPRGYHKDCLNPPRQRAPKGAWTCPKCGPVKEAKEGKDSKDAKDVREGRDTAKEVKATKSVKPALKVGKHPQQQEPQEDQPEPITATPAPLEVDRILGCRISLVSQSKDLARCDWANNVKTPTGATKLQDEQGNFVPAAKSQDGKGIEVRLPISNAAKSEVEEELDGKAEPDGIKTASTTCPKTEAGSHDRSEVRIGSIADGGHKLEKDQSSTANLARLSLEVGIPNDAASQLDEVKLERKTPDDGAKFCVKGQEIQIQQEHNPGVLPKREGKCKSVELEYGIRPGLGLGVTSPTQVTAFNTGETEVVDDLLSGTKRDCSASLKLSCTLNDDSVLAAYSLQGSEDISEENKNPLLTTDDTVESVKNDISHTSLDSSNSQSELEFLVKWVGRAHIHNAWVSEEQLRGMAKRKLENFKLKHGNVPTMLVEDQWTKPQRIVAKRTVDGKGDEVLVKWSGLSYDECTWEHVDEPVILGSSELIKKLECIEQEAQSLDADLPERGADTDLSCLRGQPPAEIETIKEQPEFLKGGSLFPHQMEALNWLRKCWQRQRSVILADEMGLGKTISACSFIASLCYEFKVRAPCLVLVPLSTMPNWLAEFALWAPSMNVIEYHGSAKARAMIREYEWHAGLVDGASKKSKCSFKFNVMLTTYEMVIADSSQLRAVPWEVLVVDEGHRLKNSGSKLFTLLNTFSFSHRVLLTGTPLQNNFGEMFNLLNFIQPDTFPSLAAFQERFSSLSTTEQVEELKKLVAPNMLRRLKKDAMQKIPPKTELVIPVDMNSVQIEYYKALLTRNYQVLRNGGKQQSLLNIVMQLRKVCNHPYLISGAEPDSGSPEFLQEMRIKASAKLMLLHSMLSKLKADGHRVLIFSQMTKLLDILEDYLNFEFGQNAFERVDGSVSVAERQAAIARFNQDTSRFVFLLSTRACGLGINLATADTVIIYDSDFNPQADIQAMNRAHRIGQSKTLLVYRLVVRASVEERILQLAKKKLMLDHLFVNKSGSQKEVDDILRWGTEELFQETSTQTEEPAPGISGAVDDGEGKLKKKGGELEDMYGGYYLQLGRSKVVWDDAAVKRLVDRSDLSHCHPEVTEGEQENDFLGSLKAWDWNEQEGVAEEQEGDEALRKEADADKLPKMAAPEEENQWDKLLRSRWETLQTEEEAALGRGKRNRKAVSYMESNGEKTKEPLSESSDAEKEDDPEPDYTPVGGALKQKLAKLRARQKERIMQRYNEATGTMDNVHLSVVTGMPTEGIPMMKKFDIMKEPSPPPSSITPLLPSGTVAADLFSQAELNGNVLSPASSSGLVNVSSGVEQLFQKRAMSPSIPGGNIEWQTKNNLNKVSHMQQFHPVTGLRTQTGEGVAGFKPSGPDQGQTMWLGAGPPATGRSSVLSQLFGRPVISGDDIRAEGVPTISLSTVSKGLESGQSLSQLIPTLRQSLKVSQYGNTPKSSALKQLDLRGPPATLEGTPTNQASQHDSGLTVFPVLRPSNGAKPSFHLEDMKSFAGHQYKSKPPDVALEFSQRIFGVEKDISSAALISLGDELSGQQNNQGTVASSGPVGGEENSSLKSHRSEHTPGLGVATQGPRVPNLSIALGLQFTDGSPTADNKPSQEVQTSTAAVSLTPSFGYSSKGIDILGSGSSLGGNHYHKLGTKDFMPIELNDDEPDPPVSTRRFLSPGAGNGMGRLWHAEDQRKCTDQATRAWTEDELDALWTGVRRHGRGNWAAMLLDAKLGFLKSHSVGELAERWKEEEANMFGNPEQLSEVGRQMPNLWGSTSTVASVEGVDQGLLHMSVMERGRASHTSFHSESVVGHPDDKFFQLPSFHEKKEPLPWVLSELETKPSKERMPYTGASNAGGPSTLSGLQFVDKIGELGRLDHSRHGSKYHNLLDLQSGRSSPSIPTSLPGRNGLTSGAVSGSFGLSSQALCRFESSLFRTGGALEQIGGGEFCSGLGSALGLAPEWRRQDTRDKISWQQLAAHLSAAESGKHQSNFSESSGLRSQELHAIAQIPPAPSPRLGSPSGVSLGNRALVSTTNNGGPISTAEHRRRARGVSAAKATSSIIPDDNAPSNLPHWLREAVKARSTPQPPLPPAIAAVVQATNLLYRNRKRLLPPLVHPGYPMAPPREFPKKAERRRRRHLKVSQQPPSSRTESVNPTGNTVFSRSLKAEGLNHSILPVPLGEGVGSAISRSLAALGQVNTSVTESKGFPDLPSLSGLDHPQQQIPHIPAGSLSELMARKSLIELGFMSGYSLPMLNGGARSNSIFDEANTLQLPSGQGRRTLLDSRLPLDGRSELDLAWKKSEGQQDHSLPADLLPSQRLLSRSSQGVVLSEGFPVGRLAEGNFPDPEKKSQLPQWLLSVDSGKGSDHKQKHRSKADKDQEDEESTSSKTVSDPGIHGKHEKDDDDSDVVSSEETISDDGTP